MAHTHTPTDNGEVQEQQWTRGRLAKLLPSPAAVMVLMLACAAYVFSLKMNRLILFLAAPAAVLTGVCLGVPLEWALCGPIKRIAAHVDARFFHGHQEGVSIGPLSRGEAIWMGLRVVMALLACALAAPVVASFHGACYNLVQYGLSHPQIVSMGQNGTLALRTRLLCSSLISLRIYHDSMCTRVFCQHIHTHKHTHKDVHTRVHHQAHSLMYWCADG